MSERVFEYELKKDGIEIKTNDKELVYKLLGISQAIEKVRPQLPEKLAIRETESSYVIGKGGSVNKKCVDDVEKAIIRLSVGKPYALSKELTNEESLKKWSRAYCNRAVHVLESMKKIERIKLGRNKYAYKPLISWRPAKEPMAVVGKEQAEKMGSAYKEGKISQEAIKEGIK